MMDNYLVLRIKYLLEFDIMSVNTKNKVNDLINYKQETIETIIRLLKQADFGLNISTIAEQSGLSRNTVKKYLKSLEKEPSIEMEVIGRSKIFFYKSNSETVKPFVKLRQEGFFLGLDMVLKAIEESAHSYISDPLGLIKKVSSNIGLNGGGPIFGSILRSLNIQIDSNASKTEILNTIATIALEIFHKIIEKRFGKFIQGEIVPQLGFKDEKSSITLRLQIIPKEVNTSEYFFHASAGFFEGILRSKFNSTLNKHCKGEVLFLDVLEIQADKSTCYYTLSIRKSE